MIYLFILLRVLDLTTTFIGIRMGVGEANGFQRMMMGAGGLYYLFNLILSLALYAVLRRWRLGRVVLWGFMVLNVIVILVNLFAIGYPLT